MVEFGEYTVALPFALVGATVGALMCYMMSFAVLRGAVMKRFPSRVSWLKNTVMGHDNVFFLVLSLRLSPMIPAWFLSQTSLADTHRERQTDTQRGSSLKRLWQTHRERERQTDTHTHTHTQA